MTRNDLLNLVVEALQYLGGKGRIFQICKYIWDNYEKELRNSGKLLYTWQYDMRWAGQHLRDKKVLAPPSKDHYWRLAK